MKYEIDLPEFDDYEPTWERREPREGDYYLDAGDDIVKSLCDLMGSKYIIMKKKKWVPKEGESYFYVRSDLVVDGCPYDKRYEKDGAGVRKYGMLRFHKTQWID